MFQCIACTKQAAEEDRDEQIRQTETGNGGGTPATNQVVKSLTAQLKGMALKFTGASRQPRSSGVGSSTYRRGQRPYHSEGVQYPYMGGVGSEPEGISSDQTPRSNESVAAYGRVMQDEENDLMWIAEAEPGVHISLVPLPTGGNDVRSIRFNGEMFDRWQAQQWWRENNDRIIELYNVKNLNRQAVNTPPNSEDEPSGCDIPVAAWLKNDSTLRNDQYYIPSGIAMDEGNSSQNNMHAAGSDILSTTSSQDDPVFNNAGEIVGEWIEQDVPGVFLTIRQLPDGSKELRRVKFSRQRFGDDDANRWWENNRERIQAQYL